jgi:AcrR family transcriptional regulator
MNVMNRETYHYGDLRTALLQAALEQIRRGGVEKFSLRGLARDVGVAPAAAYNHFADKKELLAAIALEAQVLLARRTLKATRGLTDVKRLEAIGHAYIEFACDEPRLFRLLFSHLGAASLQESYESADGGFVPSAYEQLRTAVADVRPDKQDPVTEDMLALAWSVAHGAASLISDGMWQRGDRRADAALRLALELMSARSHRSSGCSSPPGRPQRTAHELR